MLTCFVCFQFIPALGGLRNRAMGVDGMTAVCT